MSGSTDHLGDAAKTVDAVVSASAWQHVAVTVLFDGTDTDFAFFVDGASSGTYKLAPGFV
jgi:hypothetical protein